MAYHKIVMPESSFSLPPASNRGVSYANNKLYIFGGFSGKDYYDDLQIFNLKLNSWENFTELSMSSRPSRRHLHLSLYISPNYFFIYGGSYKERMYQDTYLFNTSTYNWEKVLESEANPGSRYGMCGAVIGNSVFLLGGFGEEKGTFIEKNLDDVWTFDYRSREWSIFNTVGDEKVIGSEWSCVAVAKSLYCLGSNMYKLNILDTQKREWRSVILNGAIPAKLEGFSFTCNDSGLFFVFGGSGYLNTSSEMYSLEDHGGNFIWHKLECTGNLPGPRYSHSAISIGEVILLIGGRNGKEYYSDIYAFNPNLGLRWLSLSAYGELPIDRVGHISHYIDSTKTILVHGGDCRGSVTNDMYLFDYNLREWTRANYIGDSPALCYHSCVLDKARSRIIIFGGGNLLECFSDVYALSLPGLEWSQIRIKKSISPRSGHSAVLHPKGNFAIVFGGFIPIEGYTNELWSLDLVEHKWIQITATATSGAMPIGRLGHSFNIHKNFCYLIGGVNSEVVLDDLWRLEIDVWVWERISIFEKIPGPIYGHSGTLIENHIFMYTADSTNSNGEIMKVPSVGILWSLDLNGEPEWSMYKVEGNIPPKRFYTAVLVNNDIVIYGGGPDNSVYQLDRNDISSDAISSDIFNDFILPYTSIVEKYEKPKKTFIKTNSKGSSNSSAAREEEEEEKVQVFGDRPLLVKKNTGSSSGSKADEIMHKAKLIALSRKVRK